MSLADNFLGITEVPIDIKLGIMIPVIGMYNLESVAIIKISYVHLIYSNHKFSYRS